MEVVKYTTRKLVTLKDGTVKEYKNTASYKRPINTAPKVTKTSVYKRILTIDDRDLIKQINDLIDEHERRKQLQVEAEPDI